LQHQRRLVQSDAAAAADYMLDTAFIGNHAHVFFFLFFEAWSSDCNDKVAAPAADENAL